MRSKSPASALRPPGLERCAPFGVPVVPEVRITKRASSSGGSGAEVSPAAIRSSSVDPDSSPASESVQAITRSTPSTPSSSPLNSSSWISIRGPSRDDHVGELGPGEHRVQVEGARPELRRGDRRVDEAAVVAAHDPDPVAFVDTEPGERVGESVGAAVQLLEGERAALVDQRRVVRMVDRRRDRPGGGRDPVLSEDNGHPRQLVRADRAQHPGLGQDPDLEGAVRDPAPRVRNPRCQPSGSHDSKPTSAVPKPPPRYAA